MTARRNKTKQHRKVNSDAALYIHNHPRECIQSLSVYTKQPCMHTNGGSEMSALDKTLSCPYPVIYSPINVTSYDSPLDVTPRSPSRSHHLLAVRKCFLVVSHGVGMERYPLLEGRIAPLLRCLRLCLWRFCSVVLDGLHRLHVLVVRQPFLFPQRTRGICPSNMVITATAQATG